MTSAEPGPRHYVYYRVALADLAACAAEARRLLAACEAAHPGLRAELLRRPGADADGRVTLMEVYAGVTPERYARIEHDARAALSRWIVGARQVEAFVPA